MIGRSRLGRGFTLVEIAIVLVVIGLILSGGLLAVAPVLQTSRAADTNQKLDRIEQALILHVIQNGCLPCPASPTISGELANAGRGQIGAAAYYTSGCTATACFQATQGVVPWINLGLSEADATDGFGYRIDYALTTGLQNTSAMQRTPPSGYPTGTLNVYTTIGGNAITQQAAYVLVSHGKDHSAAYNSLGVQTADPYGSLDQARNTAAVGAHTAAGTAFIQKDAISVQDTSYFDDVVRWRTAPFLIQLCGASACGNPA